MPMTLDFTRPHVLRTDEEYELAVAQLEELLGGDPAEGSEEYELLRFLSVLVEAYDDEHFPMGGSATPQAVVDFMLEQKGLTRSDLYDVMGGRSRVSEFFSGKRELSRGQIEGLRGLLGVPADLLM